MIVSEILFDEVLFRTYLFLNHIPIKKYAKYMKKDATTIQRKIKSGDFNNKEILMTAKLLNLDFSIVNKIFFGNQLE